MIFLTHELISNTEQLSKLIYNDTDSIKDQKKSQNEIKTSQLEYMQQFANLSNSDYVTKILEMFNSTIQLYSQNIELFDKLLSLNEKLLFDVIEKPDLDTEYINNFNIEYSNIDKTISNNNLQILSSLNTGFTCFNLAFMDKTPVEKQSFSTSGTTKIKIRKINDCSTNPEFSELTDVIEKNDSINNNVTTNNDSQNQNIQANYSNEDLLENTLIISERKRRVFLPYNIENAISLYEGNKENYSNIQEFILENYSLPLKDFKNFTLARFREAFKLMRERENKSISASIGLATELVFNYNLHPAIIAACKNIDELDIYLDYLENDQTYKFDCFKIIFEVTPNIIKRKSTRIANNI